MRDKTLSTVTYDRHVDPVVGYWVFYRVGYA